ncbi:MAG: amidinotransferase [Deltaproteobacteria bacterium]|nr:MAG: amidinotransferase [Deltaproteobacteria bacterium]
MATGTPGSERAGPAAGPEDLAATWGGPGFVARTADHADEVAEGRLWRRCGYRSEVAPLREVLLSWPGRSIAEVDDPDAWLMLERPDLGALRDQADAVIAAFEDLGVAVHVDRPPDAPPNYLFMRDLAFVTPEGAVLARPAAAVRAGEERWMAAALAGLGIPIRCTLRGRATFEGADALWLDREHVLIGRGRRTNASGADAVAAVLADQGVVARVVDLPTGTQHLLGVVVLVDDDLAFGHGGRMTDAIAQALRDHGIRLEVVEPDEEVTARRSLNLVTVAPRRVVMPAGCPRTRARLERAGVEVHAVEVGEYVKAGGALGCLTGILRRD